MELIFSLIKIYLKKYIEAIYNYTIVNLFINLLAYN